MTLQGSFRPGLTGNTCFSTTIKTLADAQKAIKAKNDDKTEGRIKWFWKPGDVKMVNNNAGLSKVNYKQFINY